MGVGSCYRCATTRNHIEVHATEKMRWKMVEEVAGHGIMDKKVIQYSVLLIDWVQKYSYGFTRNILNQCKDN